MFLWLLRRPYILFDADDKASGGSDDKDKKGADDGDQDKDDKAGGDDSKSKGKTFTEDEVENIVKKRLARDRKDRDAELEEERKKAQMSEAEKAKAEKEEAEKKAKHAEQAANKKIIQAEAKVQALSSGVKPDKLDYVLKLSDLDGIEVDDKGEPDTKAIKAAVDAVIEDLPELVGATSVKSDAKDKGDKPTALSDEVISKMSDEEMAKRMPEIEEYYRNKKK